jgi:hypothetical protein
MTCNLLKIGTFGAAIWLATLAGARAQPFDQGQVAVGILPVELEFSSPIKSALNSSDVIARTLNDLIFNYIQHGLERGLDRRVSATKVASADVETGPEGQRLIATIALKITSSGILGLRVSAGIVARPSQSEAEETLLLSPTIDYGELDGKVSEFALRIAKKIADLAATNAPPGKENLPRGIVRMYCVLPVEPGDRRLQQLARRLTLELPFYLNQTSLKGGLDIVVVGLDFKDSLNTCEQYRPVEGKTNFDISAETFSWYGTLAPDSKNQKGAQLSINSRDALTGGNSRPVAQVAINDATSPDMTRLAEAILNAFARKRTDRVP